METHPLLLRDLVAVVLAAMVAAITLGRLNVPAVTAFLVAGAVAGPRGLGLVQDAERITHLADAGVVLLLFAVGLELSRQRLRNLGRDLLLGGTLQVTLTVAGGAGLAHLLGQPPAKALLFGMVVALSSTAVALRALSRDELDTPHGRFLVGTLIFQDLCVVPMMLAVPVLAGTQGTSAGAALGGALLRAVAVVGLTLLAARWLVPWLFDRVDRTRSREAFLLAVLTVCLGTAWLTSLAGLSLALGAFLAGTVLADSEYSHRALSDVLPLHDLLASIFFLSLGMLFDPAVVWEQPLAVLGLFLALVVGKGVIALGSARILRLPWRTSLMVGAGLAQFSEFGFVLTRAGELSGLLQPGEVRVLLAAGVLTMLVTPPLLRSVPRLTLRWRPQEQAEAAVEPVKRHVVVVGYGTAGQVLVQALLRCEVPVRVLELNARTVKDLRRTGVQVVYGDVASREGLSAARLDEALALVLLINDPLAAERAVAAARHVSPRTPIFVRCRYFRDAPHLESLGADEVVVDEVEAGVEMLARVLQRSGIPRDVWLARVAEARDQTRHGVRDATDATRRLHELAEDLEVQRVRIHPSSYAAGQSPTDLRLGERTGALIVAVRHGHTARPVDATTALRPGDHVYLMGSHHALDVARRLLEQGLD